MSDAPTPISFYTDTHIAKAVAAQLRARGIEVVRCEEVGMAEADDESHLIYAAEHGYTIITQDADFAGSNTRWQQQGKSHAGIVIVPAYLQGESQISYIVREIMTYVELIRGGAGTLEEDVHNRVTFL